MKAEDFLVKVGDGRGFVTADTRHEELPPLVVTAAHCIPEMPPAHPMRYHHEETFMLLGSLFGEVNVYATVLFYDPIADVAVLGQPDEQAMDEFADEYEQLLQPFTPLAIAVPQERGAGVVYDLKAEPREIEYTCWQGTWKSTMLLAHGFPFEGGMSGSPILDTEGRALAVVSANSNIASMCLTASIPSRLALEVKP